MTPAQTVYKIAQLEGIVPLSGTKNEEHMQNDVAVENVHLQGEGVKDMIAAIREFIGI